MTYDVIKVEDPPGGEGASNNRQVITVKQEQWKHTRPAKPRPLMPLSGQSQLSFTNKLNCDPTDNLLMLATISIEPS